MTSVEWIYVAQSIIACISVVTMVWAKMSSQKTDDGNSKLIGIERTIERVEAKLDGHMRDHAWSQNRYDKD